MAILVLIQLLGPPRMTCCWPRSHFRLQLTWRTAYHVHMDTTSFSKFERLKFTLHYIWACDSIYHKLSFPAWTINEAFQQRNSCTPPSNNDDGWTRSFLVTDSLVGQSHTASMCYSGGMHHLSRITAATLSHARHKPNVWGLYLLLDVRWVLLEWVLVQGVNTKCDVRPNVLRLTALCHAELHFHVELWVVAVYVRLRTWCWPYLRRTVTHPRHLLPLPHINL